MQNTPDGDLKQSRNPLDEIQSDGGNPLMFHTENNDEKRKNNRFESNMKYFTISVYTIFVVAICSFIIYLIINLDQTKQMIGEFISNITPFLIALFIAFILNPMVKNINKFLKNKMKVKKRLLRVFLSIFISYLIVIGIITIAVVYITPQLIRSISDLIPILPTPEQIYDFLTSLEVNYPTQRINAIDVLIEKQIPEIINYGTEFITNMIPKLYAFSVSLIRLMVNILLSIVISCYMLLDKKSLNLNAKRLIYAIFTKEKADGFLQTGKECNLIFSKFIIGKSIDSLIIGILCFVLMNILRLPYSILFSVIVGITNMIPYFGPFIGAVPGLLILTIINPIQSLIFAAMILLIQQFDGLYLGPKILGESTGLKPLWVIFAITIGGAYGGMLGMFFGVPISAVIAHLLNKFINRRLMNKNIEIHVDAD